MTTMSKRLALIWSAFILLGCATAALADGESHCCIDWNRLNLSPQQSQQIHQLEHDWSAKYARLQPQIAEQQKKLILLLADPQSDPLEIMATQQSLAHVKEQLRNEATANYLRKRSLLVDHQQHQLEGMLHQMVLERQQRVAAQSNQQEDKNGGIGNLIHTVKWAIEPH